MGIKPGSTALQADSLPLSHLGGPGDGNQRQKKKKDNADHSFGLILGVKLTVAEIHRVNTCFVYTSPNIY